ncbi:MAG: preprotein translocase subunit SecY [Bacteroides sp.]|nr:preprotein translocase subunit SecY [Bacteroidales bacterium]MBD5292329.1 preprotein translocase subunit SecY [Bacteroides sp.]MBD5337801.1 preprotein translocase subunit SecY [Bacteroides sp.]MDE7509705.1 preprotein translocase subunit SecY [Muribaculaceae bacterium]
MGFTQTIKNIWSVEDLRHRIGVTLLLVIIYRFGCYVVLPGINPDSLRALQNFTSDGLMQLLDMFSGGAFSQASIFALGIMPYITASIVIQLLGMVLPAFQKMQREGESGRMKLNQYTRYLTVLILLLQGPAYLMNLKYQVTSAGGYVDMGIWTIMFMTIVLAAGSMFIMWLGERIDQKGVGNGISFIILIGIIARLPEAFFQEFTSRLLNSAGGGLVLFLVEIVILLAVIAGAVLLVQGTRKVPVQYAKKVVGNKQYGGARQYIPLKVNAAGVMPIIFAQAIMFIPITVAGFSTSHSGFWGSLTNMYGWTYNIIYFLMIVAFTYFYTAITVRPQQMAEDMKRNNGFIPGVKPGKPTVDYLDSIMSRITLPGSIFLGIVAIMPSIAYVCGLNRSFAQFFGGTSLLILVGVILDTLRIIEGHLLMRHYDGLMKDGRIQGRTTGKAAF